ncbi:MAG: CocE/NonD family hydrolase, partial [Ilumatobacteraceae bacterium]
MQVSEQLLFIPAADGTDLAITLYRPDGDGPFATLLEALPYRMDDITSSYESSYHRYVTEGGFAV